MRALFVSAPLPGHMDWGGMARTARLLLARGHEVVWATDPAGFRHLDPLGIPTRAFSPTGWWWPPPPMPAHLSPEARARERERRAVAVWLHPERVIPATERLLAIVEDVRPDVIVSEPFIAAAAFVAELSTIPLVIVGWPDVEMPPRVPPHQQEAARLASAWFATLCRRLHVHGHYWQREPRPWMRSPHGHIVYFTPEWYSAWRVRVPPTVFVGGVPEPPSTSPPSWLAALEEDVPLVLITLGTAFTQDEAFFLTVAEAAQAVGARAIIATGDTHLAERLRVLTPGEVVVMPWAPYEHVFPRLRLAVHHGGMGTTHAALVYGVPQIVVPRAADQYQQAARVQRTGVGLAFRAPEVTRERMVWAMRRLLEEPVWGERARAMSERMARLGGVSRAAQAILKAVGPGGIGNGEKDDDR